MKREPKLLVVSAIADTAGIMYTTPGGTWTTISAMTVTNTTGNVVDVTVYLVPSGGSPDATNVILFERNLSPGESRIIGEAVGQTLHPGGTIQAVAGTAASLNMVASGYETVA